MPKVESVCVWVFAEFKRLCWESFDVLRLRNMKFSLYDEFLTRWNPHILSNQVWVDTEFGGIRNAFRQIDAAWAVQVRWVLG